MRLASPNVSPAHLARDLAKIDGSTLLGLAGVVLLACALAVVVEGAAAAGFAGGLLACAVLVIWRACASQALLRAQIGRLETTLGAEPAPSSVARSLTDHFEHVQRIALRTSAYKSALDSSKSGLVLFDTDGAILFMSKRARDLFKTHGAPFTKTDQEDKTAPTIGSTDLFKFILSELPNIEVASTQDRRHSDLKFRAEWDGAHFEIHLYASQTQDGARVGFYAEFFNVSSEVSMESGIADLLEGFKAGSIYSRLTVEEDDSVRNQFLNKVTNDLNGLLDVVSELIADIDSAVMAMVAGDMTAKMTGEYDGEFGSLKNSLNDSISTLEATLVRIGDITQKVEDATEGVAATSGELRALMNRQQDALTETTGAIASIADSIKGNVENAEDATLLSQETSRRANDGRRVIGEAQEAMASIEESSSKIDDITKTIDAIAFQTNLLALNAAIEAARAGDAGKGFAIVAQEVRGLAKRSSDATKNIQNLVEETKARIDNGSERVGEAASVLEGISASARETSAKMAEIKTTTTSQGQSAEAIMRTTGSMDAVTRDSTRLSAENAEIAERLREYVAGLKGDLSFFIVSDDGAPADCFDSVAA